LPADFDKRKSWRRPMQMDVAILEPDGKVVCECELRDVSHDGARLEMMIKPGAPAPQIAPKFVLSLSRRGNLFRNCELVWRKENEIGLRFIRPEVKPHNRTKPSA
jgi:hypothetical protein